MNPATEIDDAFPQKFYEEFYVKIQSASQQSLSWHQATATPLLKNKD